CLDCPDGVMPRPGLEEAEEDPDRFPWIGIPGNAESMESARKVRWAMAMAVNQEALVEQILEGNGRVIYTWQNILPNDPLHKEEWVIPYDPDMARQYMEEAGYPDGFEMEVWIPGTFPPSAQRGAEATVEMWRQELGIDVTVSKTDYAVRRPQTVDKTINVPFTHGINWVPGATSARYICPAGGHIVGFTMEQDLCEAGLQNATEPSLQARIENNIRVQDYLTEQMLFIPMFQTAEALFAVSPDIAEWDPYNAQDVLPNRPESIILN
ncbi:MAG: ABC transporter substrate-binding protein, partial [Chloroflexota bacterium]